MTITNLETVAAMRGDNRGDNRDRGHSDDSNSGDDNNWRDHDHSGDTNSGEGRASDSTSQADNSYGSPTDDTQSGESSSQEGSHNDDTEDHGASNNLADKFRFWFREFRPNQPY